MVTSVTRPGLLAWLRSVDNHKGGPSGDTFREISFIGSILIIATLAKSFFARPTDYHFNSWTKPRRVVETHNRDRGASEAQRGANVLEAARPGGVCTIECAPSRRPQAAQPAQSDYAGFLVLSVPSRLIGKGS
jgi:hypothetical protein